MTIGRISIELLLRRTLQQKNMNVAFIEAKSCATKPQRHKATQRCQSFSRNVVVVLKKFNKEQNLEVCDATMLNSIAEACYQNKKNDV